MKLLRRWPRLTRALLWSTAVSAVLTVVLAVWVALPLPADVANPGPVASVSLHDRHGVPLRLTRAEDGSRGGWTSFQDIDPEIIQAFLATEDRRFFSHHGVDLIAVARAARQNLRNGRVVSGASTLTMQTARLLRPAKRNWTGKIHQALWALRLDAHMSKPKILETYLNRVPLGQGAVGVTAAARLYFGRSASDVSLAQAATLAGLAHLPSRENPLVAPERATARRNDVLRQMLTLGFATKEDAERATREPVVSRAAAARFAAPHFTTQLLARLPAGATGRVNTSIDLELQRALEAEVRHTVHTLNDKAAEHAAAVVLDNRSGDILAWVGSPNFFADTAGQVDMVLSRRQPGSTLKPFLYGLAFDRGFTPASVLPDVPRTYATSTGPYRPQNYDRRFRGPVRIREALASSYNVPAVELTDRLGAAALLSVLRDAGFASLDRSPDHYGLGLSLGNGDVTLLELANAYRGIANGGVWRPERWTTDSPPGSVMPVAARARTTPEPGTAAAATGPLNNTFANADPGRRFMSPRSAVLVLDILRDPVARIPGFGESTPLDLPFPAAAKTGTSRHFTDNWAVATTANFTVAVWVGNFNGRPMQGVSGISGAGPLLYRSALQVARRYPPGNLPAPDQLNAEPARICALSGMLATPDCPSLIEWFAPGTVPTATDTWQTGGRTMLPPEYAEWLASTESTSLVDERTDSNTARPRILSPQDGDLYELPPGVEPRYATIPLASSRPGAKWLVNGHALPGNHWQPAEGKHTIIARWESGEVDSVRVTVKR